MSYHRVILAERFMRHVSPEPTSGCWLWTGKTVSRTDPYGMAWGSDGYERAHRRSWRIYRGEIPAGLHVLHRCDVPWCVNPDHLFLGTNTDNVRDRVAKRRSAPGQGRVPRLSADAVRSLRIRASAGERIAALAAEFGIRRTYAHDVVARRERRDVA